MQYVDRKSSALRAARGAARLRDRVGDGEHHLVWVSRARGMTANSTGSV